MKDFKYGVSRLVPFQNAAVCDKVRKIDRKDICKHRNPDFKISVVPDDEIAFLRIHDLFNRIRESDEQDKRLVMILPQPHPQYRKVAYLINKYRVDCRNLFTFNMDEWADENNNVAPETYPNGFMYAMINNFYRLIDEKLRPPRKQIAGISNKNYKDYGKMMEDLGGVDLCDGGIGWSGHIAFVEPGSAEFKARTLDEWKRMGPRFVTLSPFTIAQTALDPDFGMSGDWSWIPPKAVTIGPSEIIRARLRNSWNHFTLAGTQVSWQRFTVRLAMHGPVTPDLPASILQACRTNMILSESIAANIEPNRALSNYA